MGYLLDTDIYVYLKNGHKGILARLNDVGDENIFLSSISIAELYYGAFKSSRVHANVKEITRDLEKIQTLNFNHHAARLFGRLKADLQGKGQVIADFDLAIASIAIYHQHTLVTHNTRHFSPISELLLEDWSI